MYDMSSLTYQTIHETSVMASMNDELETPEGSVYYTFNGNQEALATFQEKCQGYKQLSTATATATATTTNSTNMNTTSMVMISGRVTRLSLMNSCTEDYSIGLPACVPTSCGTDHENDVEIATALSDLLTDEDCVSVFSPTGESISSACLLDVVNTTSPAMAMSMSMAMAGCEMNNDTATATATRTAIDVSFENICGGNVTQVLEEIYCVPSSCESSEAVSELFQGHLVKITPYVDTMEMSNGTVTVTGTAGNETVPAAECEWVYKDLSFELRNGTNFDVDVDTNTTDTSTNGTVADEEEFDFDCVEYSKMTHGSKSSKNESSSSKSSKNESSSGSKSKSKKTKSSCKKSAKGGSLRRRTKAPAMPRQSIDSSDLKIRSWNPLGLNRN